MNCEKPKEIVRRYRLENGKPVLDPNGGIECTIVPPDITPEENELVKRRIEQELSQILECEVRFRR